MFKLFKCKVSKLLSATLFVCGILFGHTQANAQVNLGPDTTICNGDPFLLNINGPGVLGTGTTLSDDSYTEVIPIPFPFTYFGSVYNSCLISSNNYITFDLADAGGYSPWAINDAIPSPALPTNSIMAPYQDVNPGNGGSINYATIGTAPNRVFVVSFVEVPMFSCGELCFSNQIKLFEGTNEVQIHIDNKPLCSTWNGGVAIEGIQNSDGTIAYEVAGRNYPTQWTAQNDAYSFMPSGPNTYDVNPVPFAFENVITQGNGILINWYENNTLVGNGTTLTISPTQTSSYIGEVTLACSGSSYRDTLTVFVSNTVIDTAITEASCIPGFDGIIVASPTGDYGPYDFSWTDDNGNSILQENGISGSSAATDLEPGTYNLLVEDDLGCQLPFVVDVPGPPPLSVDTDQVNILCNGETSGSASINVTSGTAPYEYAWDDPTGSTSNAVSNLGAGLYTVTITDANSCVIEERFFISEPMPLLLQMSSITDTCEKQVGTAAVEVVGGVYPYNYLWTNNTNGGVLQATDSIVNSLPEGLYKVMVSDANGCQDSSSVNVSNLPSVVAKFTFRVEPDGILDPEATFTNGSLNAEFYNWDFGDETGFSTEEHPVYLFPDDTAQTYKVTLIAFDSYGCYDTAYGFVPIRPYFTFYIPNAFTPRKNDINDVFAPKGDGFDFDTYKMVIYDRWGNLVFQTNDMTKGWNGNSHTSGQPAPNGVYVYKIEIREPIGFEPKIYYGHVTLLWD